MRTVLLTGFEPFADDPTNPSGDAVRLVADAWTGPERLITAVFPVAFASAADALRALIDEHSPDLVIATGLAGGRTAVTPSASQSISSMPAFPITRARSQAMRRRSKVRPRRILRHCR